MRIIYAPRFIRAYKKLPLNIKEKTEIVEDIFKKAPFDSRLKTHKLSGRLADCWSFSVDNYYRVIFEFRNKNIANFLLIGGHNIYKERP